MLFKKDIKIVNVSIILPTYRREAVLCNTLKQLLAQCPKPLEIIVVDQTEKYNNETDLFLKELIKNNQIKYIYQETPNANMARNRGIRESKGEIVLFLDDDIIIPPDLAGKHFINYEDSEIAAVSGQVLDSQGQPTDEFPKRYYRKYIGWIYFPLNFSKRIEVINLNSCNLSIRRGILIEVGGFDENLAKTHFDDTDLASRLHKVCLKKRFKTIHDPSPSLIHLRSVGGNRLGGINEYVVADRNFWTNWFYFFIINFGIYGCWELLICFRVCVLRKKNILRPYYLWVAFLEFIIGFDRALSSIRGGRRLLAEAKTTGLPADLTVARDCGIEPQARGDPEGILSLSKQMRILQISCSYFPDKIGGTETYVHSLSLELVSRGHQVFISYVGDFSEENGPAIRIKEYVFQGLPVFVIEKNTFSIRTDQLYFDSEEKIYPVFKAYLKRIQPDIVNFHHLSPTEIVAQIKAAKGMGLPTVLTYHTPMMTCGHSDMFYFGKRQCQGEINSKVCLACTQAGHGVPSWLAWVWASMPRDFAEKLGLFVSRMGIKNRFGTWLKFPWLIRRWLSQCRLGFDMVDHFVAVCSWVYDLLIRNNILPEKITLCRQGTTRVPLVVKRIRDNILRIGYLGRIHPVKGIDLLLRALRLLPANFPIELYIYGTIDKFNKKYYSKIIPELSKDKRVRWMGQLEQNNKFQALGMLDVLIIPSRWLETGPLVLLEAWAVGTPVIGSKCGSISELVTDGVNGLLFDRQDIKSLAVLIRRVHEEPGLLDKLRAGIPRVRTTEEVALDMESLYKRLVNK